MSLFSINSTHIDEGLSLVRRIDEKYAPAWQKKTPREQAAMALYFLPHGSKKPTLCPTRPRVVKWYCPFASQRYFPSGHRYCVNVYTGCSHACEYCYAAAYEPSEAGVKRDFARSLDKDLADLERFNVPPAPIHLSNSTDAFQPLEADAGHTRLTLRRILDHRNRFTSVVVLTKNPRLAVELGCDELFRKLHASKHNSPRPGFLLEVSLAFWRDEARKLYDPGAPSVEDRVAGIRRLRQAGVDVVLRIDPLFPRAEKRDAGVSPACREGFQPSPSADEKDFSSFNGQAHGTHNAGETPASREWPQTLDDLERLVAFAKEVGVRHVVYSTAKIVQPRNRPLSPTMRHMRTLYESIAHESQPPERLTFRGGSWRLPPTAQSAITAPLLDICRRHNVTAKCCWQNLLETP
ncbi:MAG: hypothetical protein FWE88_03035 [Phycisphaerae bacterium]|nr:hypothetical protein [Phycisphaerae bacterium]